MRKKTVRLLIIPLLAVIMLMSTLQLAFADFTTLYLSAYSNDFYRDTRSVGGSFVYNNGVKSATYKYGIAIAIQYYNFNPQSPSVDFKTGTIRVAGAADIWSPSGAPNVLGVLRLRMELRLQPESWVWDFWPFIGHSITKQDGAIDILTGDVGAVGLAILQNGDSRLRDILSIGASLAYSAAFYVATYGTGAIFIPFDPTWLAYLNSGGGNDWKAGPGFSSDPDPCAWVEGRMGWGAPAWKGYCFSNAEVAYDFYYTYYRRGYTGWKNFQLQLKVSVDFGYVGDTPIGTYHNWLVTTKEFSQLWTVKVYFG